MGTKSVERGLRARYGAASTRHGREGRAQGAGEVLLRRPCAEGRCGVNGQWEVVRVIGLCGQDVYALASRAGLLRIWQVRVESGFVVSVRAQLSERRRRECRELRLAEKTLAELRAAAMTVAALRAAAVIR
jgi:hypothetical protein